MTMNNEIRDQFIKALVNVNPVNVNRCFTELVNTGIMRVLLPEFLENINVTQNKYHILTVDEHIAMAVALIRPDPVLRLAALLHDIGKARTRTEENGVVHFYDHDKVSAEIAKDFCARLNIPAEDTVRIVNLIELHMHPTNCGRRGVKNLLNKVINIEDWIQLKIADILAGHNVAPDFWDNEWQRFLQMIKQEQERPCYVAPLVTGEDVMTMFDLKPGKQVGEILDRVKQFIVDNPDIQHTRETLLEVMAEWKQ